MSEKSEWEEYRRRRRILKSNERREMRKKAEDLIDISIGVFYEEIEKPKGIIFKRCPICNRRVLSKRFISYSIATNYYECECGYTYTYHTYYPDLI